MRLLTLLESHAARTSEVPAYVDGELQLSWRSLFNRVNTLAHQLSQVFPPESVVLIRCPNNLNFPVAFLGTLAAGCAAFPLSVESPPLEVRGVAEQVNAAALIDEDLTISNLIKTPVLRYSEKPGRTEKAPGSSEYLRTGVGPPIVGSATRLMLLSSGSTGKPKIVCRSGDSLDAVCEQMCGAIGITADDRMLATVPLCHSYGIEHGLLAPVLAGATVHLSRGLDLPKLKRDLTESRITLLPGVPSLYEMLANHAGPDERYPDLRTAYSAGAPLPTSVANAVFDRCGIRVGQLYGASEIGSVTFSNPTGQHFESASVGQPMPGVTVRITSGDDPAEPVRPSESGHVWIAADSIFTGYHGESQSSIVDRFYPTGDLGRVDQHGNLFINGRIKLLIDVGGLKVNPLEVEAVLMQHDDVGDCVVIPVRQSETVMRLKAIITPRDSAKVPKIEEIRQFARERLATYKVPRVIEVRSSLPRTSTGKIIRHLVDV
jgi:acyl-CoA synthetase (AMP-forming)/AMP-acid ligase II